jgi:hypothetical protein
MKSTKNYLQDSFCIPGPEIEESQLFLVSHLYSQVGEKLVSTKHYQWGGNVEISGQRFLDLLEDKIVEWRLEIDGFISFGDLEEKRRFCNNAFEITLVEGEAPIVFLTVNGSRILTSCSTYTDLVLIYERIVLE